MYEDYSETSDKVHSDIEDKPPNKEQAKSTPVFVYTLYGKSPLKEDKLSKKDKTAGLEGVLIKRFHYYNIQCGTDL